MAQVKSLQTGIKFKDTPVGKIPVDWESTKLQRIGVLKGGNGFPEKFQGHKNKDYFFLKVSDMNLPGNEIYINLSSNTIDKEIQAAIGCNLFPKDTIIFAKVGAALLLNRRRILTIDSCIDNNMMGLIVSKDENYKFYYYIMQAIDFAKFVSPGALPSINQTVLGGIDVIRPPLPEQKKIAEILATVDDAIEETDRIIEKIKELKNGLMQKLLTHGIGHKKFKKTEIGKIPVEWEVGKISDFGEIVTGSTPSTSVKEYYGKDFPFVSPFDLGKVKVISKTEKYLSKEGTSVARMLPANTVLFVCIGSTIGKVGIAGVELATNQQINSIICKNSDFNFVYYYLSFMSDKIKHMAGTQAVPIVNKSLFSDVLVAIPELKEQQGIGKILSSVDTEIEEGENHKQHLETLKKSLMQVLLTGRVRVKLH